MQTLKLLIIEDDKTEIRNYQDTIKTFNYENRDSFFIDPVFCEDEEKGETALKLYQNEFCGAIVDLNLSGISTGRREGNNIVKAIYESLRFPVYVVTGTPNDIDKDLPLDNVFLKVCTRGSVDFDSIYHEILAIYRTGITRILGRKGEIEKQLDKIFWKHLSDSVDVLIGNSRSIEQNEQILLRYTIAHLTEYLDLDEDAGKFSEYIPLEFFFSPVIKTNIHTGEIIRKPGTDELFLVLTPACDMAQAKAKDVVIAKIETATESGALLEFINASKRADGEKAQHNLREIIGNRWPKYHFIPKNKIMRTAAVINFQKLNSIRMRDLQNYDRLAQINSAFVKDIVARFSYYYSRQGAPDFNREEMLTDLLH